MIMKIFKSPFLLFTLLSILLAGITHAQTFEYKTITLEDYLQTVRQNNATIGSSELDVQTANANKVAQSLYRFAPSVSYARGSWYTEVPYAPYNSPPANTLSFNFTVEGWGKRDAREALADSQINSSKNQLELGKNNIETNALYAYIDTLRLTLMLDSYKNALNKLSKVKANPKVADSLSFLNHYKSATEKDLMYSSAGLLNFSGNSLHDLPYPKGSLNFPIQKFNIDQLVEQAHANRVDVKSMQSSMDVADKNITLVEKNRNIDIFPYVALTRTPQYYEGGVSYNSQSAVSFGVTIPIPVDNYLQNADLVQAHNNKMQYQMHLRDLKVQIRVQVLQAMLQNDSARDALTTAQAEYNKTLKSPSSDAVQSIMDLRDKEGALIDAKTNYLKSVIYVWRQSGNYGVPSL
jgi:outer membrane protein TolC